MDKKDSFKIKIKDAIKMLREKSNQIDELIKEKSLDDECGYKKEYDAKKKNFENTKAYKGSSIGCWMFLGLVLLLGLGSLAAMIYGLCVGELLALYAFIPAASFIGIPIVSVLSKSDFHEPFWNIRKNFKAFKEAKKELKECKFEESKEIKILREKRNYIESKITELQEKLAEIEYKSETDEIVKNATNLVESTKQTKKIDDKQTDVEENNNLEI